MKITLTFGVIVGDPQDTVARKHTSDYKGTLKHPPYSHGFGVQVTWANISFSSGFFLETGSIQETF